MIQRHTLPLLIRLQRGADHALIRRKLPIVQRPLAALALGQEQPFLPICRRAAKIQDDIDRGFQDILLRGADILIDAVHKRFIAYRPENLLDFGAVKPYAAMAQHHAMRREVVVLTVHGAYILCRVLTIALQMHHGKMQLIRRGIDKRLAHIAAEHAQFNALLRSVGVHGCHHRHVLQLQFIRRRVFHHDQQINIALLRLKAAHGRRAVQIHARQAIAQNGPGLSDKGVQQALQFHSFSSQLYFAFLYEIRI